MIKLMSLITETNDKQPSIINNPNFQRWFGKSIMKNSDGIPMIFYHGTKSDKLTNFDRSHFQKNEPHRGGEGFYFTNRQGSAEPYTAGRETNYESDPRRVGAYFLRIENLAPDFVIEAWRDKIWQAEQKAKNRADGNKIVKVLARQMREFLESKGYDGYVNVGQFPNNLAEVVVFDPNQIKSATNNSGKFSTTNPDFTKENY
jgi:hypothetical protein